MGGALLLLPQSDGVPVLSRMYCASCWNRSASFLWANPSRKGYRIFGSPAMVATTRMTRSEHAKKVSMVVVGTKAPPNYVGAIACMPAKKFCDNKSDT